MGWKRQLTTGLGLLLAVGTGVAGNDEGNRGLSPMPLQPPPPVKIESTQHLQVADAAGIGKGSSAVAQISGTASRLLTPELAKEIENEINKETSVCASPYTTFFAQKDEDYPVYAFMQDFNPAGPILSALTSYRIVLTSAVTIRVTQAPQHGEIVIKDNLYPQAIYRTSSDTPGELYTKIYQYTVDQTYFDAHGNYKDTIRFEVHVNGYTFHFDYRVDVSTNPCGNFEMDEHR